MQQLVSQSISVITLLAKLCMYIRAHLTLNTLILEVIDFNGLQKSHL